MAELPNSRKVRNQINEMLDKDMEYRRIIEALQSQGFSGIQMYHLSRWKEGGYLDYRAHQERCEELEMRRQWAEELSRQCQGDNFDQASQKLLTILFYEGLNRLDSIAMAQLQHDSKQIVNFFRTFISFRRECLAEKKFLADEQHREKREQEKSSSAGQGSPRSEDTRGYNAFHVPLGSGEGSPRSGEAGIRGGTRDSRRAPSNGPLAGGDPTSNSIPNSHEPTDLR